MVEVEASSRVELAVQAVAVRLEGLRFTPTTKCCQAVRGLRHRGVRCDEAVFQHLRHENRAGCVLM